MAVKPSLCPLSLQTLFADGQLMEGAKLYFYKANTTTPITTYQDSTLQAAYPHPVIVTFTGRVPQIYIVEPLYRIRILKPDNTPYEDIDGIVGGIDVNEGGGGSTPPPTSGSDLITGDVIWSYMTARRDNFVICNGQTLGQETSGATGYAVGVPYVDGSEQNDLPKISGFWLYRHLWEADNKLPVFSAGVEVQRGATAISDWNSNRALGIPDLRGRSIFGLDTMSNIDARLIQQVVNVTTTTGDSKIAVSSIEGLCVGMFVISSAIPEGSYITEIISANQIKISTAAISSITSSKARFSVFPDAEKLGSAGGKATHTINQGELAPHKHNATSSSAEAGWHSHSGVTSANGNHQHSYMDVFVGLGSGIQGGVHFMNASESRFTSWSGDHAHSVTVAPNGSHSHAISTVTHDTGGGYAHNNMPPALLGTFYMKL